MKVSLHFLILLLLLSSCTPTAKPIEYGSDRCEFCKMNIVDRQHAAEVVTSKGKVYKFDAIECMVSYVDEKPEVDFAMKLVNDFANPSTLVDAHNSHFLICPEIPSPMGAYLSAFADEHDAVNIQRNKGGNLYTWTELNEHLNKSK